MNEAHLNPLESLFRQAQTDKEAYGILLHKLRGPLASIVPFSLVQERDDIIGTVMLNLSRKDPAQFNSLEELKKIAFGAVRNAAADAGRKKQRATNEPFVPDDLPHGSRDITEEVATRELAKMMEAVLQDPSVDSIALYAFRRNTLDGIPYAEIAEEVNSTRQDDKPPINEAALRQRVSEMRKKLRANFAHLDPREERRRS